MIWRLRFSRAVLLAVLGLALIATAAPAAPASAAPAGPNGSPVAGAPAAAPADVAVTIDGDWRSFNWSGGGTPFAHEGAFTFTAPSAVRLKVTDFLCAGDRFRVYDWSELLGDTSPVPVDPPCDYYVTDPDKALDDPVFSHRNFNLGPGSHKITIQIIQNPFGGGTAKLRVDLDNAFGHVFLDADEDGVRDPGETAGLGEVGLDIRRNGYWTDFGKTVAPEGWYQLWGSRRTGTYCVSVRVPLNYHPTSPTTVCKVIAGGSPFFQVDFGVAPGDRNYVPFVPYRR